MMVARGPRAGDRDIGEAAFLLEAGEAAFVERALRREHAFFPAGEEDEREFEPLGGVDGHDRDLGLAARGVIVHHQADMLEEGAERLIFLHRAGQFGEVFEPARGFGAALGLEHGGVAAFVEHQAGKLGVGQRRRPSSASGRRRRRSGRATVRACGVSSSLSSICAAASSSGWPVARAKAWMRCDRLVAEPALGGVDDALEGEVVGGLGDQAQVGERVADLGALVEAEAADDLVGEADRDEAVLELARLELGADEDRGSRRGCRRRAGGARSPRRRGALPRGRPTRR